MPRLIGIIQIALSLVIVTGLATGCELLPSTSTPSSTPTPQPSSYPADIGTYVIIAEKVVAEYPQTHKKTEETPLGNDRVWWIVEVSVKNKDYELPVTSVWDSSLSMPVGEEGWIWSLVIDGRVWGSAQDVRGIDNRLFTPEVMSVSKGQTGSTIFLFEALDINLDDAQICYRGQEPYSFGELSGGDRVAVYDWGSKSIMTEQPEESEPKQSIVLKNGSIYWEVCLNSVEWKENTVTLDLSITNNGDKVANFPYHEKHIGTTTEFALKDRYDEWFDDKDWPYWYDVKMYPSETRRGEISFTVHPLSGDLELYVTWYTGTVREHLFYIENPNVGN